LDGWQRSKADSINAKKRDEERRLEAIAVAKEDTLCATIPVLDSFDMAFGNEKSFEGIDANWIAGMKSIQSQLLGVFSDYGVTQISPLGEKFDPSMHESVEIREVENESDDDKVLEVIQKGYIINDKVLRAAKVAVGAYRKD
jgi:molecular chaperone GrpE